MASTPRRSWSPYLLSPGLSPCSRTPAEEETAPPPELLSALELWGVGSGPAGAKVLPSVGGSGGWKVGDMCFLFRVPPRRWAWKSISFTPKLHREKKQSTHHASRRLRQKPVGPRVLKPRMRRSPRLPSMQQSGTDHIHGHPCYQGKQLNLVLNLGQANGCGVAPRPGGLAAEDTQAGCGLSRIT